MRYIKCNTLTAYHFPLLSSFNFEFFFVNKIQLTSQIKATIYNMFEGRKIKNYHRDKFNAFVRDKVNDLRKYPKEVILEKLTQIHVDIPGRLIHNKTHPNNKGKMNNRILNKSVS